MKEFNENNFKFINLIDTGMTLVEYFLLRREARVQINTYEYDINEGINDVSESDAEKADMFDYAKHVVAITTPILDTPGSVPLEALELLLDQEMTMFQCTELEDEGNSLVKKLEDFIEQHKEKYKELTGEVFTSVEIKPEQLH